MRRLAAIIAMTLLVVPRLLEAGEIAVAERRSGYGFMTPETKAMQDDETANPGMLWVMEGETLWAKKDGTSEKSCADCHGDARDSMKGVAARYPAFDQTLGRPVDLEQRINLSREQHQQALPFASESHDLLALSAFITEQSHGMPITPPSDPQLAPFVDKGRELFMAREGQLNLSCANCHDDNWDKRLAGSAITQGQPTGYPLYRLEWQSLGSLQRRLRGCMTGVRAQAFDFGSPEMVDLELYLMTRAAGMPIETPAVRP
jgi:sulfur-oxidizing protein SoxA